MTETARLSDYVLPAATQFEKFEATFFNFEYPARTCSTSAVPCSTPPEGPLPEPEIHARIVEAAGLLDPRGDGRSAPAAERGRDEFAAAFAAATADDPRLGAVGAVVLYRTLGPTLPHGARPPPHRCGRWCSAASQINPDGVERAGFGTGPDAGDRLFDAIVDSPSGVVFTDDTWEATWRRIKTDDGLVHVEIPELLAELAGLADDTRPATTRRVADAAVGGRASLVHRQHDPPRPRMAEARRAGRACASRPSTPTASAWSTATACAS